MKLLKSYIGFIQVPVFKIQMLFVVNKTEKQVRAFVKNKCVEIALKDFDTYESFKLLEDKEYGTKTRGLFSYSPHIQILNLPSFELDGLVHEICHATRYYLARLGIYHKDENTETYAYLEEYLFKECCNRIKGK